MGHPVLAIKLCIDKIMHSAGLEDRVCGLLLPLLLLVAFSKLNIARPHWQPHIRPSSSSFV